MHDPSKNNEAENTPAYEPPRLERHGKLAEITRTRFGTGGDMVKGRGSSGKDFIADEPDEQKEEPSEGEA